MRKKRNSFACNFLFFSHLPFSYYKISLSPSLPLSLFPSLSFSLSFSLPPSLFPPPSLSFTPYLSHYDSGSMSCPLIYYNFFSKLSFVLFLFCFLIMPVFYPRTFFFFYNHLLTSSFLLIV
jgi:hypothetical protein